MREISRKRRIRRLRVWGWAVLVCHGMVGGRGRCCGDYGIMDTWVSWEERGEFGRVVRRTESFL